MDITLDGHPFVKENGFQTMVPHAAGVDKYRQGVYNTDTPMGYATWRKARMDEEKCCCGETITDEGMACSHKTKQRGKEEYKKLIHRLNRIEGQIRGIRGMVEKNAYCTDILVQVAAVNAALAAFNRELLGEHIKTCVKRDILAGKDETIDELLATLQKLMK